MKIMSTVTVEILNPKAGTLLRNLADLNLINIKKQASLSEMLAKLRSNEASAPSLEEITKEVECVRQVRYEKGL